LFILFGRGKDSLFIFLKISMSGNIRRHKNGFSNDCLTGISATATFLGCSGREIFSEEYMGEDEVRNGSREGLPDSLDQ